MSQTFLTHNFKKTKQGSREVATEQTFMGGIQYTDRPLDVGYLRMLINYDIKQRGMIAQPRGGFQTLHDIELATSAKEHYIHHIGTMYIADQAGDAFLRRYLLIGPKHVDNSGMLFSEMQLAIENPADETLVQSTLDVGYVSDHVLKFKDHTNWKSMHDTSMANPIPVGIFTHLDGNTYMMTQHGLVRLKVTWDGANYTHTLEAVDAHELSPTQAVNYGYNMLDDDPYVFQNQETATLRLHGILPYKGSVLKMDAKVGEDLKFVLVYDYPTGAPQYKVQWEIQDTMVQDNPVVLEKVADSATYTGGDEIAITTQPIYKSFSIICKLYDAADLTEPLKVMILASYHLTEDNKSKSSNLKLVNYDMHTTKDMCTWQNQVVAWGIDGAKTAIFISDVNDPTYFPYPQNAVPYEDEIIKAVPYLESKLLVFTATSLHMVERTPEGVLTSRGIQENLDLRTHDAETIKVVRNMVYFKSDNYFYMIVPNNNAGPGELQLAPISENVSLLLDSFERVVTAVVDETYNLAYTLNQPPQDISTALQTYYNYLDNNKIHNVYKYKIILANAADLYIEFHLIYDTMQRNWTAYLKESNNNLMVPYQRVVTEGAIYANVYNNVGKIHAQLVRANPHQANDTFYLEDRVTRRIKNYQMIDTGKRNLVGSLKKRYREMRFEINNLEQIDLEFHDMFIIDDDTRVPLFRYTTQQDTDPVSPNYGLIYVQREYEDPTLVRGATTLGAWTLGASQFPPQTVMQIRIGVSGKGYYPRFKLLSMNEKMYELLTIGWVYRMMNAR